MSERENKALSLTNGEIYETTREMMGPYRVEPLSAFNTEEHLQRTLESFRNNPNILVISRSDIIGGNELLAAHQADLELRLYSQDTPNKVPRATALNRFFRIGFGMVENTVICGRIGYPNEMVSPRAYDEWAKAPREERVAEIRSYLRAQDADVVARNLLEGQQGGSMMEFACDLTITVPRVTGDEPYRMSSAQDPEAREQLTEGVLTALYLLREHQVGQEMLDMNKQLTPPAELETPVEDKQLPPETYLG